MATDIDTDDPKVVAAIIACCQQRRRRNVVPKGETLLYYGPAGESRLEDDGATIVEPIGPGRQTVVPPMLHPDTGQPSRSGGLYV